MQPYYRNLNQSLPSLVNELLKGNGKAINLNIKILSTRERTLFWENLGINPMLLFTSSLRGANHLERSFQNVGGEFSIIANFDTISLSEFIFNATALSVETEVRAREWRSVTGTLQLSAGELFYPKEFLTKLEPIAIHQDTSPREYDPYMTGEVYPYKMINTDLDLWFRDVKMFCDVGHAMGYHDLFFRKVALPILTAHRMESPQNALKHIGNCAATDWRLACAQWIREQVCATKKS